MKRETVCNKSNTNAATDTESYMLLRMKLVSTFFTDGSRVLVDSKLKEVKFEKWSLSTRGRCQVEFQFTL